MNEETEIVGRQVNLNIISQMVNTPIDSFYRVYTIIFYFFINLSNIFILNTKRKLSPIVKSRKNKLYFTI